MSYKGWYKLQCPEKFIKPLDEFMESYQDGYILYKSRLEQKFMVYCDINKHVTKFSLEPFAINYIKPTDGKVHRYFIDFFNFIYFLINFRNLNIISTNITFFAII